MPIGLKRSLPEVLDAHARSHTAEMHTGVPAKIVKYDPVLNTIDAEIVVKDWFFDTEEDSGERTYEEHPVIPSVPVVWPRGGGYVMTLPLQAGDFVWLMFSEASLAEWRTTGQLSEPLDSRRHSIGYPYALPGAFPDVSPLSVLDALDRAAKMIIGKDGGPEQIRFASGSIEIGHTPFGAPIKIGPTGILLNEAAVDAVALATPTMAGISAAFTLLTSICTALAALKTAYDAHTHVYSPGPSPPVPTAPPNNTAPAAPPGPGAPAPVAALTVKAL